jgi:TctA family transporter
MKGLNPGPMIFVNNAPQVMAIFLVFLLANLLLLPLGLLVIRVASKVLVVPKLILAPLILVFCIVGSYAIDASASGIVIMLVMGVIAYMMEEKGFQVAPTILGIVMGGLVERSLTTSLIKSDGSMLAFFERPIAGGLGVLTLTLWCLPILLRFLRKPRITMVASGS